MMTMMLMMMMMKIGCTPDDLHSYFYSIVGKLLLLP